MQTPRIAAHAPLGRVPMAWNPSPRWVRQWISATAWTISEKIRTSRLM